MSYIKVRKLKRDRVKEIINTIIDKHNYNDGIEEPLTTTSQELSSALNVSVATVNNYKKDVKTQLSRDHKLSLVTKRGRNGGMFIATSTKDIEKVHHSIYLDITTRLQTILDDMDRAKNVNPRWFTGFYMKVFHICIRQAIETLGAMREEHDKKSIEFDIEKEKVIIS